MLACSPNNSPGRIDCFANHGGGSSVRRLDLEYGDRSKLKIIAEKFEDLYKSRFAQIDVSDLPTIDKFKDAVEDLCQSLNIRRFNVLFDEAAHIFRPEQQRQFFTLFRDLRSPYMTCNAAVYPGVTAYGDFLPDPPHDAQMQSLHRDVASPDYVDQMREIVFKQAGSELQAQIIRQGSVFAALAYAASGKPTPASENHCLGSTK